jgi:hypothetical protein
LNQDVPLTKMVNDDRGWAPQTKRRGRALPGALGFGPLFTARSRAARGCSRTLEFDFDKHQDIATGVDDIMLHASVAKIRLSSL